MIDLLIALLVVILVVAVVYWALERLPLFQGDRTIKQVFLVILILILVLWVVQRFL